MNSLLTGNLTGKFAVLGDLGDDFSVGNRCAAATFRAFPTHPNRENNSRKQGILRTRQEVTAIEGAMREGSAAMRGGALASVV
jgi:hypothetical protein